MTVVRLYFDADSMQRSVVQGLRARGVDVKSAQEEGMAGATDEEQLEHALGAGRSLFSHNISDFHRLHTEHMSSGRSHAGIVLAAQQQYSVGDRIRRLLRLVSTRTAEEMKNGLVFLSDLS